MSENLNLKTITTIDPSPFKHLCVTIGELPSSFLESMSYYEMLAWFVKYLETTVIPAVNENGEATAELQEKFIELKTFVDTYFDNLDVQQEINNKLDEMAEDGTLQEIVGSYLSANAAWCFNSVAEMIASTNLINGSYAKTTGYYANNDGGGGFYKIRNVTASDTVDGSFIIEISDTLVAELIIQGSVSIKTLGGRSQAIDGTKYDIKPYIDKYIAKINSLPSRFKLLIPSGVWYSSACDLTSSCGFDIEGEFAYYNYGVNGTVITTLNDNQQYLFNIGTNVNNIYTKNFSLKNIQFSTFDYTYQDGDGKFHKGTAKAVTKCVVNMLYAIHGITDNLTFINIVGEALRITSCWENKFPYLVFRYVSNPNGEIMSFRGDQSYGSYASISSTEFTNIFFESTHGDLIGVYSHANISNNHFGSINFEPNEFDYNNQFTYTSSSTLPDSINHLSVINLKESTSNFYSNTIDEINLNGFPTKYYTYNTSNYIYDHIIKTGSGYIYLGLTIGTITNNGGNQPIIILENDSSNNLINYNYLHINNISTSDSSSFKFNLNKNFTDLYCNGVYSKVTTDRIKLGEIQKFYKNLTQNNGNSALYTDDTALFDDKIVVALPRYISEYQVHTYATGQTLYVLAKIPLNESCNFRYSSSSTGWNEALTGTGEWKWYAIDMSDHINVGDKLRLKVAGSGVPADCYFDSFFMK